MSLDDFLSATISASSVSIGRAGFGSGNVISYNAAWVTPELTRRYGNDTAVAVDFPNPLCYERRVSARYFAQRPKPTALYISKAVLKPTKVIAVTALNATGNVSYPYKIWVGGEDFEETLVTFTSDGTPTDAEFASAAVSALNAVVGKNYTASGATSPVLLTGTTGKWFYARTEDRSKLQIVETTANPGTATDIAAIAAANSQWYAILSGFNSSAYSAPLSAFAEVNEKLYLPDSSDTRCATAAFDDTPDPADDPMNVAAAQAYRCTAWSFHPNASAMYAAGLAGRCLIFIPGEETWALKSVQGAAGFDLTDTEYQNILAKNGNTLRLVDQGVYVNMEGRTASGEFIDVVRVAHWQLDDVKKGVVGLLISLPKVPITDPGLQLIGNEVRGSLDRGVSNGAYSSYELVIPLRSELSDADVANRVAAGFEAQAILAGAVHFPVLRITLLTSAI